ncbi:FAD dependent oxidoreductase [compost metagenome]
MIGCADDIAYGSLRVMGTAFATGHAAGVAAAIGAELSGNVEVAKVRERLADQGAFL